MIFIFFLFSAVGAQQCDPLVVNPVFVNVNPLYDDYDEITFQPFLNITNSVPEQVTNQIQSIFQLVQISNIKASSEHMSNYSNGSMTFFNYPCQWAIAMVNVGGSLNQTNFQQIISQNTSTTYLSLPTSFTSNQTQKFQSYQFSLFAFVQLNVTLQIVINESDFDSYDYEFMNTTMIENKVPNRALYNQSYIFVILMQPTDLAQIPMNPLTWSKSISSTPQYIISYSTEDPNQQLTQQQLILNSNSYNRNSQYWGQASQALLPYIPYFSNCKGFGQFLYLSQLMESTACTLVNVSQTKPINPYLFGDKSIGDQCNNINFQCIIDEPISQQASSPRWFELSATNPLFQMIQDPRSSSEISESLYDEASVVKVLLTNSIPSGYMASEVQLNINYFQVFITLNFMVTQTQKRIISGSIIFQNLYIMSPSQQNNSVPITYNLSFNYMPLTQPALVNAFALKAPVYFILYLGIGTLSVLQIVVFFLYHYFLNRKQPRPKLRFWQYAKTIYPSSIKGTFIALWPMAAIYILISLIMNGQLYRMKFPYACSLAQATATDAACATVIFDLFKNNTKYSDPSFPLLRAGRSGITCIICGLYFTIALTKIFVQDYDKDTYENEAYNGNIWYTKLWCRGQMFYITIIVTFFMVVVIQFSFSNLFGNGNNSWYFLIMYKIVQIVIEYILEKYFDDSMKVTPLAIIMAITISIAMMGNATFYAFLFSFFVDLGSQMLERAYIMKLVEDTTEYLENQYTKLIKMLKRLMDGDQDEDEEEALDWQIIQMTKIDGFANKDFEQQDNHNSDSDIIFSDEYEENFASDDESINSQQLIARKLSISPDVESSFRKEDQDEFEEQFKQAYVEKQKKQLLKQEDYVVESLTSITDLDDLEFKEIIIPYFENFSADIVTLQIQPFLIGIMWLLYDQSQWASNYQISKNNFIFYLIWAILLIPFQIVIDIIFYNLIEQYHELDFLSYLYKVKVRFQHRKTSWVGQNPEHSKVERSLITLDQYCFSSQYYFLLTLYVSATFMVMIGIQIMYYNSYNLFSDQALLFICIFWYIVCVVVEKIFMYIGQRLGIWKIQQIGKVFPTTSESTDQSKPNLQTKADESNIDEKKNLIIPNWDNVIQMREAEVRLIEISNNLSQDQLLTKQFRKLFITSNKNWLKDNLKQVFSPSTLKTKRKLILTSFINLYGSLDTKNADEQAEKFDKSLENDKLKKPRTTNYRDREIVLSSQTKSILKYWLFRSRHIKKATQQIGGLLEQATKQDCEYCGLNWGLHTNTEVRVEDLLLSFIKHKNIKSIKNGSQIDEWQNYFQKQAKLRTICLICEGFLVEGLYGEGLKIKKKQRKHKFSKIAKGVFYWLIFYRHRNK